METREDMEEFVNVYNNEWLHQGLDYVTPDQKHEVKANVIINERNQKHQQAIQRGKRTNQERSENGKNKKIFKKVIDLSETVQ